MVAHSRCSHSTWIILFVFVLAWGGGEAGLFVVPSSGGARDGLERGEKRPGRGRELQAAEAIEFSEPLPYQVTQREGTAPGAGFADVVVRGPVPDVLEKGQWQYRVAEISRPSTSTPDWRPLEVTVEEPTFRGVARVAAGGWYRLELRCQSNGSVAAEGSIAPLGVGEVFLVAGQSYASNCNDERLSVADHEKRVVAFDSEKGRWRTANDPQPAGDASDGGSVWPPLGDALARQLKVPIGFANVAVGATSSLQWLPGTPLYQRLSETGEKLGRFRAVLWQQGESDVIAKTSQVDYVANLVRIRSEAARDWNFEPPWLLAKSTHHPTVYQDPEGEGRIRSAVDKLIGHHAFLAGPDTDQLKGENRGALGTRRHFSPIGQRRAAEMWRDAINGRIFGETPAETPRK